MDYLKFFPHEKIRPGQKELVEDIYSTLKEKKILFAHAPTGLGKTASALSMALAIANNNKKIIFFLTNRHTQHKIAIETLDLIKKNCEINVSCVDLIGKKWMCNQEVATLFGNEFNEYCKVVVEKGECEFYTNCRTKNEATIEAKALIKEIKSQGPISNEDLKNICADKKMCSYEIAMLLAKKADVIIGDYNHLFHPYVRQTILKKIGKELEDIIIIVDEGHNLPSRVTEMVSSNLSSIMIKNSIMEAKKFGYKEIIPWLSDLMKILNELSKEKEQKIGKQEFKFRVNKIMEFEELINQLEIIADEIRKKQNKSFIGGVSTFLENWLGDDLGFTRILKEKDSNFGPILTLSYSCLDPSVITKNIFEQAYGSIIMSGTLQPTFMYKDLLGVKKAVEKEYKSPFPLKNRLWIIVPDTSTKYTLRGPEMYKKIAKHCSSIINKIPGNSAIFFPSYQLRDNIGNYLDCSKKQFWEQRSMTKEEKLKLLREFQAARIAGGVLLAVSGGNFSEGIDFPGDLLKAVLVIGLPLAKPNLKTKELIKYYDEKYEKGWNYGYIFPAMNKCFQSAGRCIRSEKDRGIILFLDERFAWEQYRCCFPKEGVIVTHKYSEYLNDFFNKK